MDAPRKEGDTLPPFLPAEDFSTGVFDMAQRDDHLLGTVVAGRYTVMRLLGSGGMGRVYEAFDAAEQREVAIKVLHTERVGSPAAVQRFIEEARVLSMLSHPNVVRLVDFGQDESGVVYLAMELLAGRDLGDHLAERRRLPWSEASEIALQLVRGLSAAHERGVVHRDLKPENVFLVQVPPGASPKVKLLDFGIAKDLQAQNAKLTGEGSVFGTARYMSPEQASGSPVDARADVYGVGILIYEMITGRPPFIGDDFMRTAHQHVTDPVPPLSHVAPDVPFHPLVEEVVMRALAKRREDRFSSMFDFEAAIEGTTIESTMAIILPRPPVPRPAPAPMAAPMAEERTVIRAMPLDDRAGRPMPVAQDHTAAIPPPSFDDDDHVRTEIRPPTPEPGRTLVPPSIDMRPPPEERTVIRAAPVAPPPEDRTMMRRPMPEERTVIRPSPLGVAGTIVPLTQPPPAPGELPMPYVPPPQLPPSFDDSVPETMIMQAPLRDAGPRGNQAPLSMQQGSMQQGSMQQGSMQQGPVPPPPMPMQAPMQAPMPYAPPSTTPLATPVVRLPAPPPAVGASPYGAAPPPPVHASPRLGGLVGGPGAGYGGGGLAGLPMPSPPPRDAGGLGGGEAQPVFAREVNESYMAAHLAPTRLASPLGTPSNQPARVVSPEEALSTPYRPRSSWPEESGANAESSWVTNEETGEMLLRPPTRETSRNLVVAIVILVTMGLATVGFVAWTMLRDTPEVETTKPHRAASIEQPRPVALPREPERKLVIKDTEPPPRKREPERRPEPEPVPEPEPFEAPEPRDPRPRVDASPVSSLSSAQLDAGFKKARASIDACAKKHGAIEGTNFQVSFEVEDGRAINVKVQPPHGPTPLGRCVVSAVGTNARFAAAQEPARAVTRKVSF